MSTDYSKQALFRFLDTVVQKGWMNQNTAGGLKAACVRILDDVAENEDVRGIDVNTAVIRYNNRNPGALAPNSLAEYQRRVARAILDFVSYVKNPAGFRPRRRGSGEKNVRKMGQKREKKTESALEHDQSTGPEAGQMIPAPGLALSFPLRQDFLAQVVIPRDLKADEAKRLGAFLLTLALDYRPSGEDGQR